MKLTYRVAALAAALGLMAGCAANAGRVEGNDAAPVAAAAAAPAPNAAARAAVPAASAGAGVAVDELGVRVQGVRLSASGYVVDVRYRVVDPEKAKPLLDRKVRPVLVDTSTGNRFYVPAPPIVGALRQTARNKVVHTDRNYFILFANPDRQLQVGSIVSLHVGHQTLDGLRVEAN